MRIRTFWFFACFTCQAWVWFHLKSWLPPLLTSHMLMICDYDWIVVIIPSFSMHTLWKFGYCTEVTWCDGKWRDSFWPGPFPDSHVLLWPFWVSCLVHEGPNPFVSKVEWDTCLWGHWRADSVCNVPVPVLATLDLDWFSYFSLLFPSLPSGLLLLLFSYNLSAGPSLSPLQHREMILSFLPESCWGSNDTILQTIKYSSNNSNNSSEPCHYFKRENNVYLLHHQEMMLWSFYYASSLEPEPLPAPCRVCLEKQGCGCDRFCCVSIGWTDHHSELVTRLVEAKQMYW